MNSLNHSFIEVLIDFINSIITLHVFYKQLHFLLQPQVTYSCMNFQSESCLAVAYSIEFQLDCLIISAPWSINFQMVFLFYMSLSSLCLFSIHQLTELLAEP